MNKYIVEFVGTFFLVLVVGLSVIEPGAGTFVPIAIGSVLMVMVYAGGPISGAHYNPAVTIAVWMRGKCETKDVVPYIGAQIAGAVIAASIVRFVKEYPALAPMSPDIPRVLLIEFLFTFALAFVVLNVATSKKSAGNNYYGLAIAFTVVAGAYSGGVISGAVFNPAVATGITIMGLSSWGNFWIYMASCFTGGVAAAMVYKIVNPDE